MISADQDNIGHTQFAPGKERALGESHVGHRARSHTLQGYSPLERLGKNMLRKVFVCVPKHSNSLKGFTFIEVIVVIAVIAIISGMSAVVLSNLARSSALKAAQLEVYQALADSRNKTLASYGANVYGVRVGTSTVTRFTGATYTSGAAGNIVYSFEGGTVATGTLVSSNVDIVFARLSGAPSATGTIFLTTDTGNATRTITIHASGLVE